jgi:hypothetical protein
MTALQSDTVLPECQRNHIGVYPLWLFDSVCLRERKREGERERERESSSINKGRLNLSVGMSPFRLTR